MTQIVIAHIGSTGIGSAAISKLIAAGMEVVVSGPVEVPDVPTATTLDNVIHLKDIHGPVPEIYWNEGKQKAQWKRETKGRPRK